MSGDRGWAELLMSPALLGLQEILVQELVQALEARSSLGAASGKSPAQMGARSGNRTRTALRPMVFETIASACSAIRAGTVTCGFGAYCPSNRFAWKSLQPA